VANSDPKTSGAGNVPSRRHGLPVPPPVANLVGLEVVAVLFVIAACLTWRKWPDALVDFGIQLDVPWRILHGAVLYRDLFYFAGGPFSQYFNALLFKIFGVSFTTLLAANLILAGTMILVVYRYFLKATDVWTATMIGVGIVTVFTFAEYVQIGNYNYIAPYSHEATHGLVLSIFAIAALSDWIKKGKTWTVAVAGLCLGIVFLTKPEIFLALVAAIFAGVFLFYLKFGPKNLAKSIGVFFPAALLPSLFFFFYFLREENYTDSLRSVFFGWTPLFAGKVMENQFYLWCLGLDAPLAHSTRIIVYSFAVFFVLALYAVVLRTMKDRELKWIKSRKVSFLVLISPLLFWAVAFDWRQCGWPLPFLALAACLLILWNYKKLESPPVFPLLWSVFGLVLLAKLGLFPRISHYGFVLAMPAFVSGVYLLFWLLPILLENKFAVPSRPFRIMVGLVLLIGFGSLFDQSQLLYAQKTLALGNGGDKIITYHSASPKTQAISDALLWTEKYLPGDATLAVLPEGVMLNYLTRHENPTPCLFWDPNALAVFGQGRMTAAFERNAPDYIFIADRDFSEFGVGHFGNSPNFGQGLMQWVQKNYQTEAVIDSETMTNGSFAIKILKRLRPSAQSN
jgi:Dolichyl-phosphate-mannose-protein mannosyltransferase